MLTMTNESREYTMNLLATMVAQDIAKKESLSFEEAFSEFRKTRTFMMLYESETGLWLNGPDYIFDEYNLEKRSCNQPAGA